MNPEIISRVAIANRDIFPRCRFHLLLEDKRANLEVLFDLSTM